MKPEHPHYMQTPVSGNIELNLYQSKISHTESTTILVQNDLHRQRVDRSSSPEGQRSLDSPGADHVPEGM